MRVLALLLLAACSGNVEVVKTPGTPGGLTAAPTPIPQPPLVTLTWTTPATNTDGTALVDLTGYHVFRGGAPDRMAIVAQVGASPYVDSGLPSGKYFYAVSALNAQGDESALSPVVWTVVP